MSQQSCWRSHGVICLARGTSKPLGNQRTYGHPGATRAFWSGTAVAQLGVSNERSGDPTGFAAVECRASSQPILAGVLERPSSASNLFGHKETLSCGTVAAPTACQRQFWKVVASDTGLSWENRTVAQADCGPNRSIFQSNSSTSSILLQSDITISEPFPLRAGAVIE
jgi:hypothetical protein